MMAKTIKLKPIIGIEGKPMAIPEFDEKGEILKDDKGYAKVKIINLNDLLNILIRNFPRERMTMENITHGTRLKSQMLESKDGALVIEEAEHDWVKKMLKDETIGPKIFGFDLLCVIEALEDFERKQEKAEVEK